jgi:hypothetical protein
LSGPADRGATHGRISRSGAVPVHERPFIDAIHDTDELPPTPQRAYRIPASGWRQAPEELLHLGDDLGEPVEYKRRIGRYLLWRAGPPIGEAWYMAVSDDRSRSYRFRLSGKQGTGLGPDGREHLRFRTWKESLLADSTPGPEPEPIEGPQ